MKQVVIPAAVVALLGQVLLAQRVAPSVAAPDAPPYRAFRMAVNGRLYLGAIAVDAAGNVYVTGGTSADLPATNGERPRRGSRVNAFVTKFDPDGRPLWSSYVGGSIGRAGSFAGAGGDFGLAIAVDPAGQPVIVGTTTAADFPVVNPFIGSAQASNSDGFVAKLSSDGRRLIYSSYFGGRNGVSQLSGVAIGPAGETWVAGSSGSNEIATHFDVSNSDSKNVIVLKLNPAGGVVWSTRMSGTAVHDFAVDALGQPHIAAGCWPPLGGNPDACSPFVAKLSASGSQQLYRERVGAGLNEPVRLSLSPQGQAVAAGRNGVSDTVDPWPSVWGLTGTGFVRMLDQSGKTVFSNAVNATFETQAPVHASSGERLLVAFNTTVAGLPTERAVVPNHVDGPFFSSDDGAATWANIGGPGAARSIHIDPERDQVFVRSASFSYRSDDGGRTWTQDPGGGLYFAVDPRQPNVHWSASGFGPVFRRVDGGAWQRVGTTELVPSPTVTTLAVSPHDGSAWLGGEFGVEIVTADGRAFRFENDGLPAAFTPASRGFLPPRAFAFDPQDPSVVYAATPAGMYGRFAFAAGWVHLTSQLGSANQFVVSAAVDPADTNVLFIGRRDGMFRSTDRGRTWQQVLSGTEVRAIVPDPNRPGVIYASGHRIYRSLDHGATWQSTASGYESRLAPSTLAINPKTSRLYVSSELVQPIGFVMEISGAGAAATRSWATYLEDGPIFDVTTTLSGAAVLGLSTRQSEVMIVRIGQ